MGGGWSLPLVYLLPVQPRAVAYRAAVVLVLPLAKRGEVSDAVRAGLCNPSSSRTRVHEGPNSECCHDFREPCPASVIVVRFVPCFRTRAGRTRCRVQAEDRRCGIWTVRRPKRVRERGEG